MDIVKLAKLYSNQIIRSDDLSKFHFWITHENGPLYRILNDCCIGNCKCIGRTCDIGNLTFKTQGHYTNSLYVKFKEADDSTYVELNKETS